MKKQGKISRGRSKKVPMMTPKVSNNQKSSKVKQPTPTTTSFSNIVSLIQAKPTGMVNISGKPQKRQSTIQLKEKKKNLTSAVTLVERLTQKLENLIAETADPSLIEKIRADIKAAQGEHERKERLKNDASPPTSQFSSSTNANDTVTNQQATTSAQSKLNAQLNKVQTPKYKMNQMRINAKAREEARKSKVSTAKMKQSKLKVSTSQQKGQEEQISKQPSEADGGEWKTVKKNRNNHKSENSKNSKHQKNDNQDNEASSIDEENDEESSHSSTSKSEQDDEEEVAKINKNKKKTKKVQPKLSHNKINRPLNTYLSVKLSVQASNKPVQALIQTATNWFKQMRKVDDSIVLYDYRDKTPTRSIHKPKLVPNDISAFKHFFANANPLPKGGAVWINAWIGHTDSADNIKANMSEWDITNNSATYIKQLQRKHTVKEHWLMWSTINTDAETLKANTMKILKKLYPNKEFDFAFVWNVIRSGEYSNQEKKSRKGNQYVRALHVEVPVEQKKQIYSILLRIFSSASSIKIHEMKLRMVPTWKKEYTSHRKQKIQHLINKHKHYLSTTSHVTSTDFTDIDYFNKNLKTTLRQIIMNIETMVPIDGQDKCPKIFQSIDYSSYYSGYVLTFPKYLTQQATDIAPQMPSFLYWLYGEEILPMLSPEAAVMAIEEPWDPELMRTISKIDTALDDLAGEVEHDFEWLSGSEDDKDPDVLQEDSEKAIDMSKMKTGEFIFNKVTDTDSISTFATKRDPAQRNLDNLFLQNPAKRTKIDDESSTATVEMRNMKVAKNEKRDSESEPSEEEDDSSSENDSDNESDSSDESNSEDEDNQDDSESREDSNSEDSESEDSNSENIDRVYDDYDDDTSEEHTDHGEEASSSNQSMSAVSASNASENEGDTLDSSSQSKDGEEEFQEQWKVDFQPEEKDFIHNQRTNVAPMTKNMESKSSPMQTDETGANQIKEAGDPPSDQGIPSEHDPSDSGAVL